MSTSDSNRPEPVKGAARSASKAARARTAKVGEANTGGAIKGKAPEGKAPASKALEGKAGKASAEPLRSPVEATSDADALLNSPDLTEPGTTPPLESPSIGDSGDLGRSFSARLRELRRARALSLRKLGREVGVTANAVLRWEKDEVTPTRGKMIELSRFFEVEPAWLAWGIGARRNRLKPSDLLMQLERCDETQLRAVSALLEAFDPDSFAG
jgi:transcriptional regulator with XRE-family HTH domain